jgi:hypothetical protein
MPESDPRGASPAPQAARLKRWYVEIALHAFNILLTFTALNVLVAVWMALRPTPPTGYNPSLFPRDRLAAAYGDLPMDVVTGTLDETWNLMRLEARPWVHYGEAARTGKYVNVSREGVRSNGRPEAPAGQRPFRVFAFGGSTMWGYGVPDAETIPAHLERALAARHPGRAIEVRNYGRGYYGSAQESALFLSLIRRGITPDAAVFLDGLNEATAAYGEGDAPAFDQPARMRELSAMWKQSDAPEPQILPDWLPVMKMIARLRVRARGQAAASAPVLPEAEAAARGGEDAAVLLRMYGVNRRVTEHAARDAGVAPYFFLQPIPVHAYDPKKLIFPLFYGPREKAAMRALYASFPAAEPSLVDLSAMLAHHEAPAYIDAHHYAPAVCKLIAERIAERLVVPDP